MREGAEILPDAGVQAFDLGWMAIENMQILSGEGPMASVQVVDSPPVRTFRSPRVLLADDEQGVLEALQLLLELDGVEIETARSPKAVLQALSSRRFDLLVMDLNYGADTTSGLEGLDLITKIRTLDDTLPMVAMTAWGSMELAIEAMRRGVGDFVLKPWDNCHMLSIIRSQIAQGQSRRLTRRLLLESEEVLRSEVTEACEVQRNLMPKEFPLLDDYEFSAATRPARSLGGDYYDVFYRGDGAMGLCIADVCGKGIPAALLMANLQATVQSAAVEGPRPGPFARRVNSAVCRNLSPGRFVTLFYCLLDIAGRRLCYTNAGHNAPVLLRATGQAIRLDSSGPVLGVFNGLEYQESEVSIEPGDRLVLFTDGISEADNHAGEEFGEDRIIAILKETIGRSAGEIRDRIFDAVDEFSGGCLRDDATIVVMAAMRS